MFYYFTSSFNPPSKGYVELGVINHALTIPKRLQFPVGAQFIAPNPPSKVAMGDVVMSLCRGASMKRLSSFSALGTSAVTTNETLIDSGPIKVHLATQTIDLPIENLVVVAIIAFAAIWLIRRFTGKKKGCDSCDKCE